MKNTIKNKILLSVIAIFCALSFSSCDDDYGYTYGDDVLTKPLYKIDWYSVADSSVHSLNRFLKPEGYFVYRPDGMQDDFHYWHQAHVLDVLVDAYLRVTDADEKAHYITMMDNWYTGVKAQNNRADFENWYIDDMEWIGLATLRAYQATGDTKFLDVAKHMWERVELAWDETYFGGGLFWTEDRTSKNACSNGPGALLALNLYKETQIENYKEWGIKVYGWLRSYLYDTTTGAVYDNIKISGSIDKVSLSYNQGTFMGSALALYEITGKEQYLVDAKKACGYTLGNLSDNSNNLLRDEGSFENALFRGVFIRNLHDMINENDIDASTRTYYKLCLDRYAQSLWRYAKVIYIGDPMFSRIWDTPPAETSDYTLPQQLTACIMMEMKYLVENNK